MTETTQVPEKKKLTVGTILKAKGGWDAVVIWVRPDRGSFAPVYFKWQVGRFYAIHQPEVQGEESEPIRHDEDGCALELGMSALNESFSRERPGYDLPCYNGHPADLDMTDYEL